MISYTQGSGGIIEKNAYWRDIPADKGEDAFSDESAYASPVRSCLVWNNFEDVLSHWNASAWNADCWKSNPFETYQLPALAYQEDFEFDASHLVPVLVGVNLPVKESGGSSNATLVFDVD